MPSHRHDWGVAGGLNLGNSPTPVNTIVASASQGGSVFQTNTSAKLVSLASVTIPNVGGSTAHTNMQPFLAMNFVIALAGLYPSRG